MQKRGESSPVDHQPSLRLAAVVSPFIAIIILQLALATFSLQMVTSLRAYVTGESLWSKGQNDAIYYLNRYIDTSNAVYLTRYRQALDVPLGDRDARLALEANPPDHWAALEGFSRGGNHPADIPGLIWVFENFSWFFYVQQAVEDWRNAEPMLFEMQALAAEVAAVQNATAGQRQAWKARLDGINDLVRPLTVEFSSTLGQGTRFVQSALFAANLAIAALFVVLTLMRLSHFVRHRSAIERELSWRASHDDLTKLPNRGAFELAVTKGLADKSATALLFIDLDQFKVVNDTAGHAAGDTLLCTIAEVMPAMLGPNAMLARLGGDEFGVLFDGVEAGEALRNTRMMRSALSEMPFIWKDQHFAVSASIGFVRLVGDEVSLEAVLRAADIACYAAKERGRDRVHVYSPADAEQADATRGGRVRARTASDMAAIARWRTA